LTVVCHCALSFVGRRSSTLRSSTLVSSSAMSDAIEVR
jgi:hypothetical protein